MDGWLLEALADCGFCVAVDGSCVARVVSWSSERRWLIVGGFLSGRWRVAVATVAVGSRIGQFR